MNRSPQLNKLILQAQDLSKNTEFNKTHTEHVVTCLLKGSNPVVRFLLSRKVDLAKTINVYEDRLKKLQKSDSMSSSWATASLKLIMAQAEREAKQYGGKSMTLEHLFLAILKKDDFINSLFVRYNVTYAAYREYLEKTTIYNMNEDFEDIDEPKENPKPAKKSQSKTPVLDSFTTDITKKATEGRVDPIIGRQLEVERLAQILARRKKNNAVVIGESGVGKTALVEGLAVRIVNGEVPQMLKERRIVSLDLGSIVAGTKYRGQFEERMKSIIKELEDNPNVLLFIDEIHTIVGAGNSTGSLDASNIMKPALANGRLQCIGTTTLDEYREHFEKDAALDRRFQKIILDPPSLEETKQILRRLKDRYEKHHHAEFNDRILDLCCELAERYITDRHLPDSALDVLDEAGSRTQVQLEPPATIKELESDLLHLKDQKVDAVKRQAYEEAAAIRDKEVRLKEDLEAERNLWLRQITDRKIPVTETTVREVVSMISGVPIGKVTVDERKKLLELELILGQQVVGQPDVLSKIAKTLRRNKTSVRDKRRPVGSFLFIGSTGVGKTETAKALAELQFGDRDMMIRVDMSELMEKHSVSKLIGAPPGYVGHESGGELTERVRRKPFSVLLFDEIEKAHPDVFNIFLQILDEGQLTDGLGRKVSFRNCIIIMTSNVGTKKVSQFQPGKFGFQTRAVVESKNEMVTAELEKELKRAFPPEFLNRVDEIVYFNQLSNDNLLEIVEIKLKDLCERLAENGFTMNYTKAVRDFVMEHTEKDDENGYGARPLNRAIMKFVEEPISEALLKYDGDMGVIKLSVKKNTLEVNVEPVLAEE